MTSVPVEWAEKNEALLSKFLAVTSTMNMKFLKQKNTMIPVIAKAAGMDEKTTHKTMSGFEFPSIEKQLSKKWLGGGTQVFLKQVADFFVSQGVMKKSLESYDDAVNNEYLQQAKKDI